MTDALPGDGYVRCDKWTAGERILERSCRDRDFAQMTVSAQRSETRPKAVAQSMQLRETRELQQRRRNGRVCIG